MSELPYPAENVCKNCSAPLTPAAKYCPSCGQKKYLGPPTLWMLFSDFFEAVFNLDNRLFRTLRDLPIPGQLTIKYLGGKQQPFFRPLRLFFVSTVLMLSAFAFVVADQMGEQFDLDMEESRAAAYHGVFEQELRQQLDTLAAEFPAANTLALLDTVKARYLSSPPDTIYLGVIDIKDDGTNAEELKIAEADFYAMPTDSIIARYNVDGWMAQYQIKQILAVSRSGSRAVPNIMGQLIWGVLFLVPLAALMLKLLYIRRKRIYVEHLVFTLHVHAFLFLVQALAAMLFHWFGSVLLWWVSIPVTILYFIIALKRTYQQSWFKTLLKTFILYLGYCFILSIAFGVGVVGALLLY